MIHLSTWQLAYLVLLCWITCRYAKALKIVCFWRNIGGLEQGRGFKFLDMKDGEVSAIEMIVFSIFWNWNYENIKIITVCGQWTMLCFFLSYSVDDFHIMDYIKITKSEFFCVYFWKLKTNTLIWGIKQDSCILILPHLMKPVHCWKYLNIKKRSLMGKKMLSKLD